MNAAAESHRRQEPHDRLARLLRELEREHGPIEPHVIDEVRREWPAPTVPPPPAPRRRGTGRAARDPAAPC